MYESLRRRQNKNPTFSDLAEAEGELAAGYFVEYSGISFALFFLGEYSNMLVMCALLTVFFCGAWFSPLLFTPLLVWLGLKIAFFTFFFVWLRATFPRKRYDQLMSLG